MNERIQELAEQAGFVDKGSNHTAYMNFNHEKFAELILRECLNKIESKRSRGENTDQWTITRDMCYRDMMEELNEHFGFEE